jgi:hypothetical protein
MRKKPVSHDHKKRNAGGGKEEKPSSPEPLLTVVSRALSGVVSMAPAWGCCPGPLPGVVTRVPAPGVVSGPLPGVFFPGPLPGVCLLFRAPVWDGVWIFTLGVVSRTPTLGWCPGPFCGGGGVRPSMHLNELVSRAPAMGGVKGPYLGPG